MIIFFFYLMTIANSNSLSVSSPSFKENTMIPSKFTCDGTNINPEINITNVPPNTKTLALIMDDPDAPKGTFVHWVIWNINVTNKIAENSAPGMQGLNGRKENKYTGPCPPSGTHHYHFKVYALDVKLDLPMESDKAALEKAMNGHILAKGELIGLYKRG